MLAATARASTSQLGMEAGSALRRSTAQSLVAAGQCAGVAQAQGKRRLLCTSRRASSSGCRVTDYQRLSALPTSSLSLPRRGNHALHKLSGQQRAYSSAQIPTHTAAPGRSVLSIQGRDVVKILNALVTTNASSLRIVTGPESGAGEYLGSKSSAHYCAFLNPQGRMLATAFLYMLGQEQVYIDVDASIADELLKHIIRFKLRAKAKVVDVTHTVAVATAWGGDEASLVIGANGIMATSLDVRAPGMGVRALVQRMEMDKVANVDAASSQAYAVHRMVNGVAETTDEIQPHLALPLEYNVDIAHGVDFRKGCYVGQELTARTHHTGVVRKRVVPVAMYVSDSPSDGAPQQPVHDVDMGKKITEYISDGEMQPNVRLVNASGPDDEAPQMTQKGRRAGKLLSRIDNVGLALLRVDSAAQWGQERYHYMLVDKAESEQSEGGVERGIWVRPFVPSWWPEKAKKPE